MASLWSITPQDSPEVLENSHSSVTSLEQGQKPLDYKHSFRLLQTFEI